MNSKLLAFTKHEYSPQQRLVMLVFAALLFVIALPMLIVRTSRQHSQQRRLPRPLQVTGRLLGTILGVIGWPLALWSVVDQFTRGRGTPVPVMATQALLVDGPYRYSRNPMALGTILAYLGIAVYYGAQKIAYRVLLGAGLLMLYVKLFEEQEMEARFGRAYVDYKAQTPFLFPFWNLP